MPHISDFWTDDLREALRVPLSGGGGVNLSAILADKRAADIAEVINDFSWPEALAVFNGLDDERAADVLSRLETDVQRYLLDNAPSGRITELLERLPMDDAAWVVSEATPERAETLLSDLDARAPEDAAEVRELLTYDEATAGRLMTDKFVRLSASMTVEEAFATIRLVDSEVETVTDLYVVAYMNAIEAHLIGVLSLRELVRAHSTQRIGDIMTTEIISVSVDTDQQDVARLISKYDFLAMPVLDRNGLLVGIVTVDDIIDVMVEEFNEDIMRMVGSDAEEMDRRTPAQVARMRLPWLMGTMMIELFAGGVIARYGYVLKEVILLASFMPVISAISGNVGLQAAAIVVRGLDTGHVSLRNWGRSLKRELVAAVVMALVCGIVLGGIGAVWSMHATFGLVVGVGMTCSMFTASCMGTIIPMLSKRFGFDPATTAGPFETAFQDVIGFAVFLWLASLLLPWLK